jgi:divalent metal cation (Fe/Co/Zn/Cd) transporter
LDAVAATGVALIILWEGGNLMWRSSQRLMNEAVDTEVLRGIQKALESFDQETMRFDHVITRRSGQRRFVDLRMHMPSQWTLKRAADVRAEVSKALMAAVQGLRATYKFFQATLKRTLMIREANSICFRGRCHELPQCCR